MIILENKLIILENKLRNLENKLIISENKLIISDNKVPIPENSLLVHMVYTVLTLLTSSDFCSLLIIFANSLDPDQEQQNVSLDLDPIHLTL